jgi:hypothetical protein
MLTNVMGWLRRRVAARELFPDEFRAERMDANWRPEYLEIGGHVSPVVTGVPYLLYR